MSAESQEIAISTLDGLFLSGALVVPSGLPSEIVVLVHGGGVTREEGGFFTRIAEALCSAGIASLRYDLRGHGASQGLMEEATLSAHLNDIRAAIEYARRELEVSALHLLGASFGGGLVAYYAAKRPGELERLVLLNPQLDYKNRYIDQKSHWQNDRLAVPAAELLRSQGHIHHSSTVKHGRAILNEVFWIRPCEVIEEIEAPTLIVHGTRDTFVSVDGSLEAARRLRSESRLITIDGAQHGFAIDKDPAYRDPQTQEWQKFVIENIVDWINRR
ncbi:hypothetical protein SAMN05421505_1301 [Sinosporangium album]|uniref:Serine aminopeptidase S33 domain-containing protein n=1 Tax=Sinosporangium album TaxID=504805 RepID=A0A1G8H0I0_9ACTN|nr:alpha/beta fold hydrolase [Sinosporangium album]SDI00031.1 hypothetical protein SAMN05421505_1301 [Sinosporangium album]